MKLTLPTDSEARKDIPVLSGCMNYFPAALAEIAKISVRGDRKHNQENAGNAPVHARGKSMDHGDCIIRHTMDIEDLKANITRRADKSPVVIDQLVEEAAYRAWRACAELQELCEKYAGAPLAPAAKLPEPVSLLSGAGVLRGAPLIAPLVEGEPIPQHHPAAYRPHYSYGSGNVNETGQEDAHARIGYAREQRSVYAMKNRVAEAESEVGNADLDDGA